MNLAWVYHPVTGLADAPPALLPQFPRESGLLGYASRFAAAVAMRAALRALHRFAIDGRENLPADGRSYILVANHSSHLDGLCLLSAVPLRRIHRAYPAAARDYFFRSRATTALAATLINAVPFDRGGSVRHSMGICRELLRRDGNVLIIFPEGTRSTDGMVGPFHRGVGDLVAGTDVPVVPCYLDGAGCAWPKGSTFPRPTRVRLVIGSPRTYPDAKPGKASARAIGQDLRRAVLALAPPSIRTPHVEGGFHDSDRSPIAAATACGRRGGNAA
ncbi:MAG TPA: lysophospholipid acyltransferase family protein [Tepidisphaeraceae bacterium]|nr:lysophospholipid acyltransferase family protein [Tepidisphaeraceae bacterium]